MKQYQFTDAEHALIKEHFDKIEALQREINATNAAMLGAAILLARQQGHGPEEPVMILRDLSGIAVGESSAEKEA